MKNCVFFSSPDVFFQQLEKSILAAREEIVMQFYIFRNDAIGTKILRSLEAATKRGVKVLLVVDGFGSKDTPDNFFKNLAMAGGQIAWFRPNSLIRRLHRKVVVIDRSVSFIGGINIGDEYLQWLDFAVMVEGESSIVVRDLCLDSIRKIPIYEKLLSLVKRSSRIGFKPGVGDISVLDNDWLFHRQEIYRSLLRHFENAESEILIFSGYFVPNRRIRLSLERAQKRGVKIRIILGGRSDIPFMVTATRYFYHWAHKAGIEVVEISDKVVHAKLICVDWNWFTIGSFNIDQLSIYRNLELNLGIRDLDCMKAIKNYSENMIKASGVVSQGLFLNPWQRFCSWIAYKMGQTIWFFYRGRDNHGVRLQE